MSALEASLGASPGSAAPFAAKPSALLAQMIGTAFAPAPLALASPQAAASKGGGRRRKLWQLPNSRHCPLIGACLPVAEMRKLAARAGLDPIDMSDYSLHISVVELCDQRSELAELIQRWLDQRHAATIQRFSRAQGAVGVMFAWREALAQGQDIAGALWAAWTHPDLAPDDGDEIYGDIHMLSHQVGASACADLRQLEQARQENSRLRAQTQALRLALAAAQRDKELAVGELRQRLAQAERRASALPRRELELDAARRQPAAPERAAALAARVARLEEINAAQARNAESMARELGAAQQSLAATEAAFESALETALGCGGVGGNDGCGRSCPAEAALAGRCVLCVGGRSGLVDGYRRLVETRGGRFAHHDGGQQESLHRMDAAIAAADAVVCQAGCVSHAAYFRLKEACKKLGKPCVFVQSPGVGSFARSLAVLGGAAPASAQITLLAS